MSSRKVALITGASSGIGRATAVELAGQGWDLALGARRLNRLEALRGQLEPLGSKVFCGAMDLTDMSSVDRFMDTCFASMGSVDLLILNAGMAVPRALSDTDNEVLRAIFDTNLFGPIRLCQLAIRRWARSGVYGDLFFVSSEQARTELPHLVHYGASKAAFEFVARGLRRELVGTGSRVMVMQAGATDTEFRTHFDPQDVRTMLAAWENAGIPKPLGRRLTPECVARSISYAVNAPHHVLHDRIDVLPHFVA